MVESNETFQRLKYNCHDSYKQQYSVDPLDAALVTLMFGMVIHFGTMWTLQHVSPDWRNCNSCYDNNSCSHDIYKDNTTPLLAPWLPHALFIHEYWIYLQHFNVLANPLCQRLDREYGIELLRANKHWAIAGTLSAYWCRESISMFLCLAFLWNDPTDTATSAYAADDDTSTTSTSFLSLAAWNTTTRYWIVYSLMYHAIKSHGIRDDALRRYSPRFGVMSILIDNFYLHSLQETFLSIVRLLLQGIDTWIHGRILVGLYLTFSTDRQGGEHCSLDLTFHVVFSIWVIHAAMNQYFKCSTATLMVQTWNWLSSQIKPSHCVGEGKCDSGAPCMDVTDSESDSSVGETSLQTNFIESSDEDFTVRNLLKEGRVPSSLNGRQGTATTGVDAAVQVETTLMIISVVFIIGFGRAPFLILNAGLNLEQLSLLTNELIWIAMLYAWLLYNILDGIKRFVFPRHSSTIAHGRRGVLWHFALLCNLIDLTIILMGTRPLTGQSNIGFKIYTLGLALIVTSKSFLRAMQRRVTALLRLAMFGIELAMKVGLAMVIVQRHEDIFPWIDAVVSLTWICTTVCFSRSVSNFTSLIQSKTPDIVFLGHPFELSDYWALWMIPYSLNKRWERPWWTVPLWPLHYMAAIYTCRWRARLFGDRFSFLKGDDVSYAGIQMQTWISPHFARHFVTSPWHVKENIEAAARYASHSGVKVLCLGALNKAEGINGGGITVARSLPPQSRISVIHGNHLTAAAVVETTHQCFGKGAKVFLTGASSKVGWAVAQALRNRFGYEILCHTTDQSRRELFQEHGFLATSKLIDGMAFSNLWIVGKYDEAVARVMPQGGTAVVFAVPHPLTSRGDVRVVEAGTLHLDLSRLDKPRQFSNKLMAHEIFACHAAGIVAASRIKHGRVIAGDTAHEIGPVNLEDMDSWLDDAKSLGFRIPYVEPVNPAPTRSMTEIPTTVVVGAGPAGLAVAASLRRRGIACSVLDEQETDNAFGSWDQHFSGLEITTQKHWCQLPGFPIMDEDFPGNYMTALDYQRYLDLYCKRFGIVVHRGMRVNRIIRGGSDCGSPPWVVEFDKGSQGVGSVPASAVVLATGKHRVPKRDTSDKLCSKLCHGGIQYIHSADLKDSCNWEAAIQAARRGRLCVVGFGNSAADICTAVLKHCEPNLGAIHLAARTVPPVFQQRYGLFGVDTIGSMIRFLPGLFQEAILKLAWRLLPSSVACDQAFPTHLSRWSTISGKVPVIDKHGLIESGLKSGLIVAHGPIQCVVDGGIVFDDNHCGADNNVLPIDMVVLAIGYQFDCLITREDPLNGLFLAGFGETRLLPIKTIGEEAEQIAAKIAKSHSLQ